MTRTRTTIWYSDKYSGELFTVLCSALGNISVLNNKNVSSIFGVIWDHTRLTILEFSDSRDESGYVYWMNGRMLVSPILLIQLPASANLPVIQ
jgi:hypothetical protein